MKLRRSLTAALALVGAVAVGMVVPSPASAAESGPWEIVPQSAQNSCLEVAGGTTASSAQVQIWKCPSSTGSITPLHHRWIFRSTDGGYYRLVNGKSGKCMNIKGSTDTNSAKIIQYECGKTNVTLNDQWSPYPAGRDNNRDFYILRSRLNPAKCLNVQGGATANGTDLILFTCSGAGNSVFSWKPAKQT